MTVMDQWSFTAPFEGVIRHLYIDSAGKITAGIGFLLPDEAACARLVWDPNVQEAVADFRQLRELPEFAQPKNKFAAGHYQPMVHAYLSPLFMHYEFARRMDAFRRQLRDWRLENAPMQAQIAVLDLCYNLGPAGVNRFVKLKAAVQAKDWAAAAEECHRNGVSNARNAATSSQFLACAK